MPRSRLLFPGALLIMSLLTAHIFAQPQRDLVQLPGELIRFKTSWLKSGELLHQGHYTYSTVQENGVTLLRQAGQFTYVNGNRLDEESILAPAGRKYMPRSLRVTVTAPNDKVIRTEQMTFDLTGRKVRVIRTYNDPTGQDDYGETGQVDKTVSLPPDTYPRQMFDAVLRGMELRPGSRQRLNCITKFGEVYPMILAEEGSEVIQTPAGRFDTTRVRIIPDIPLLPTILPSLTIRLWYTKEMPRVPVKFEGYAQPPPPKFQPEVRMVVTELVRPK